VPLRRGTLHSRGRPNDLIKQIEETERLIANEVIVGTEDQIYASVGLINRTVLTAAEIGNTIVNILLSRLAVMRAELEKFGTGEADDPPAKRMQAGLSNFVPHLAS
jgi:hypothetical protein